MTKQGLTLSILPDLFAICRLDPRSSIPDWARAGNLFSVTRTPDELSIVCSEDHLPSQVKCEKGWRCLKVEGPLALSLPGILASLAAPLANAGIPIFAISTFDTDYLLVKANDLQNAMQVLRQAGHRVQEIASQTAEDNHD